MLKHIVLLCLHLLALHLLALHCAAQTRIVYRAGERTLVVDIQSRQATILDTTLWNNEKLVGISVDGDSLACLYSINRSTFTRKYDISRLTPLPKVQPNFEHKVNPNSYFFHSYYFNDYRLVMIGSNGIALMKNDSLLWQDSPDVKFRKDLDNSSHRPQKFSAYKNPILSPDGMHFLIMGYRYNFLTPWVKLYEVDMRNGEMKMIRKNADNPSYSPNCQYIMFSDHPHGNYYIIDRKSGEKVFHYGLRDAFWLAVR